MSTAWVAVGLLAGWWMATALNRRVDARRDALQRRIGWGYGYGAGYSDAKAGREYDLTAPEDGRSRPSIGKEHS